jgi:CRP-like cAMP-binding protein
MPADNPLHLLLRKFEQRNELDAAARAAVLALPYTARRVEPGRYIVREGDKADHCVLLCSGFAYRHKIVGDGSRQIVGLQVRGDVVDLQNALLTSADHNVQALTEAELAMIPKAAILALAAEHPAAGRALWTETLVEASIAREWVANVGRRDSHSRLAHVLCEFAMRQEAAGLGERGSYDLPLTQEQLADVLGLTSVHVNRTLKSLEADQLIERFKRSVTIVDWERLRAAGDFNPLYLHLQPEAER